MPFLIWAKPNQTKWKCIIHISGYHTHNRHKQVHKREEWILVNWKKHTQCARRLALIPLIRWNSREAHRNHTHTHAHTLNTNISFCIHFMIIFNKFYFGHWKRWTQKVHSQIVWAKVLQFKYNSIWPPPQKNKNAQRTNIKKGIEIETEIKITARTRTREENNRVRKKSQIHLIHSCTQTYFAVLKSSLFCFIAFEFWRILCCVN